MSAGSVPEREHGLAERLRRCLLIVAALSVAGTAIELAMLRHWKSAVQLIPWAVLVVLGASIAALAWAPSPRTVAIVRAVAVAVVLTAAFGVVEHIRANYDAGFLDARYATTWATMSKSSRWWAALIKTVGPAPSLAPAVLAQAAFCVWLATVDHPALAKPRFVHAAFTHG